MGASFGRQRKVRLSESDVVPQLEIWSDCISVGYEIKTRFLTFVRESEEVWKW